MSIREHLNKIRNAIYGREVREAIAKGIEETYNDASEKHDNANMEVKMARGTHSNLNERLDNFDVTDEKLIEQLNQKITKNRGDVDSVDLSQEVKEIIHGDRPLPIAEVNSILEENIVDGQVTTRKTDFMERIPTGSVEEKDVINKFTEIGNIDINTGVIRDNSAYRSTGYLSLEDVTALFRYVNDGSSSAIFTDFMVGFYSSKTPESFISGTNRGTDYTIQRYQNLYGVYYEIPDNAEYVRFTVGANNIIGGSSSTYHYLMIKRNYQNKVKHLHINPKDYDSLEYLYEKTVVNLGDSIFGNIRDDNSVSSFIAKRTTASVKNVGFGGTRASVHSVDEWDAFCLHKLVDEIVKDNSDSTKWQLQDEAIMKMENGEVEGMPAYFSEQLDLLKSIDFKKVEFLTIAYGTNDYTGHIPIQSSKKFDVGTYKGSLNYSLEKIMNKYKKLNVLLCTPIYRYWEDDEGNFLEDSDTREFNGQTLIDFVEKTKEVGKEFHTPVLDNYFELGINKFNRQEYFPPTDGTHPNAKGNAKLGHKIGSALISEF